VPKEGTITRKVYDILFENRGRAVHLYDIKKIANKHLGTIKLRLEVDYGLDIRYVRHSVKVRRESDGKNSSMGWMLAGEEAGCGYLDYVNERL